MMIMGGEGTRFATLDNKDLQKTLRTIKFLAESGVKIYAAYVAGGRACSQYKTTIETRSLTLLLFCRCFQGHLICTRDWR